MSVKTRDWLKFGTLVTLAFALGLAFASAFRLPTRGEAAVLSVLQDTSRPIPRAKAAVDLGDAFASVAEHVKPAVVFIKSERRERVTNRRLPPGFEDSGCPRGARRRCCRCCRTRAARFPAPKPRSTWATHSLRSPST